MSRSIFARLAHRYGTRVSAVTRRGFLRATLTASAGLLLSQMPGCSSGPRGRTAVAGKHIVIVGGGYAGLACAHELLAAGYDVTVLEARSRPGGRVFSSDNFVQGRNIELGAELIGSNHPMWVAYADRYGLSFLDVSEYENLEVPLLVDGKPLSNEQARDVFEQMDKALAELNALARNVDADQPWRSPNARALDQETLAATLDRIALKLNLSPQCKRLTDAQLASDNAVPTARQSLLGMLTAIKGGGVESYWTESEVYRCKGGNGQLGYKLAEAIGQNRIRYKTAATKVHQTATGIHVTCSDGTIVEADELVLAAPPSVWHRMQFEPVLPASLQTQMGVALKHFSSVKRRFWLDRGQAPDSLSDGDISQTWDGTDNQLEGEQAGIVAFSGGEAASHIRKLSDEARTATYRQDLSTRLPGYEANVQKTMMMDWPGDPWTLAGYSFPAPGDITRAGSQLRVGFDRIHFAGEHTCYKFVGFMEGGLSSGAELALRIARRDGVVT